MKQSHPSRKTFGEVFTLIFKIYFKDFWRNLAFGALIAAVCILFFVPYFLGTFSSISLTGYPFTSGSTELSVGTWASYLIGLAVLVVFAPALSYGYFGPKTIDYLEQKSREKGQHLSLAFRLFGRISGANAAYFFSAFLILAPMYYLVYAQGEKLDTMSALYGNYLPFVNYFVLVFSTSLLAQFFNFLQIFTPQTALFEQKRGFSALGKAIKTLFSGNFWETLGYVIVIGLVLYFGTYVISIVVGLLIFLMASLFISFGTVFDLLLYTNVHLTMREMISLGVIGLILVAFISLIGSINMGLSTVFKTLIYFNAKTRSENVPFPSKEEDSKTDIPESVNISE